MRLIDKDEFDRCLADAQSECKKNGGNFRYGVLNQVRGNLAEQPTIDAIPVKWLKAQNTSTKYYKTVQGQAVELVLELWHKEQDVR